MVRAMLAAPALDTTLITRPRSVRWAALALSLLLHLMLALAWMGFPLPEPASKQEKAITVELAPERPKPKPATPPKSQEEPPAKSLAVPQLQDGVLAEKSSPPREKPAAVRPSPLTQPSDKPAPPAPVTQNERDFVLSQVLRHWQPPRELSAYSNADVRVTVTVGADGFLTDLYDARRPPNPAEVFDGYGGLPPQDIQRRTVDAFYQAIRKAQPLRLPPALKAKAPFPVRLDFRFKDVR